MVHISFFCKYFRTYHLSDYSEYVQNEKKRQRTTTIMPLTQDEYEFPLTQLIVYAMLPLSIVSVEAFRNYTHSKTIHPVFWNRLIVSIINIQCVFFAEITTGSEAPADGIGYRIVSPFTISKNIDRYYDMEKINFITELSSILYVCGTSDIWSTRHTSYMGVTIHWINQTTMKMVSKYKPTNSRTTSRNFRRIWHFE